MNDTEAQLTLTTAALALLLRENPHHSYAETLRTLIDMNRVLLKREADARDKLTPDRTYWRSCDDRRLLEEARDSRHELCISLGERLEEVLAELSDDDIARMDEAAC